MLDDFLWSRVMDVAGSLNLHSEAKKMWKGVLAVRGGLGVFIAIFPPAFYKEVKSPSRSLH
jgi:hypothetical protein